MKKSDKGFFLVRRLWFSTAILSLFLPSKNGLPSRKIGPTLFQKWVGPPDKKGRPDFPCLHISPLKTSGKIYNDSLTPLGNGNELMPNALMLSA